jgi:inorganic pyrophosphatase
LSEEAAVNSPILLDLDHSGPTANTIYVVVETPRGAHNKFKYDEKRGLFVLNKALPLGMAFPHDFGFIPSTRGEDGDPLDVLILMDAPAFPGCIVSVRLLGVLEAEQVEKGRATRNDRLLAALETPDNAPRFETLHDIGDKLLEEMEQFFISYNRLERREFRPLGRQGPKHAQRLVEEGARLYSQRHHGSRVRARG